MKSDTYMFAPLVCRQSYLTSAPASSAGEFSREPVKKKEKKLVEDVEKYLKYDCYMYAPLVKDSPYDTASESLHTGENTETGNVCDRMEARTKETARQDENTLDSSRDFQCDDSLNPTRRIVVKHKMLQSETVKHIVHRNCRSSSVPAGEVLSRRDHRKIAVE